MSKHSAYQSKSPDVNGEIEYSAQEDAVWRDLFAQQKPMIQKYSAPEYLAGFEKIGLPADRVPQCADISTTLRRRTGWTVTPVPALIGFGRFFGMLANREFPAASFIRDRRDFDYIKEPDIFHEIFGHTPLLADDRFAKFSQAIGQAGLKADPTDYSWLIRLYWFSVEFGLTSSATGVRALGSGLASSPSELKYSVTSDVPDRRPFDVLDVLRTPYRIDILQPVYFVLDKVDDLFQIADRDLLADVRKAKSLGLFAPTYPTKKSA